VTTSSCVAYGQNTSISLTDLTMPSLPISQSAMHLMQSGTRLLKALPGRAKEGFHSALEKARHRAAFEAAGIGESQACQNHQSYP